MKRYKVNRALFLIIPCFLLINIGFYLLVLYKKSNPWANFINLTIDFIFIIFYLTKFVHEISIDSKGTNFYTIFAMRRVKNDDIIDIRQSDFLTKVICSHKSYYVFTTSGGKKVLKDMLKDILK